MPNFGANLQALGTKLALEKRGCEVSFVDFRPPELIELYRKSIPEIQQVAHEKFVTEHLPLTERVTSQNEFIDLCNAHPAEVYVTGSDAVFRVSSRNKRSDLIFPNPYWLEVQNNPEVKGNKVLKFALSPSAMGCSFNDIPVEKQKGMGAALNKMDYLSARDLWTKRQMELLHPNKPIPITPDPVFLLADLIRESTSHRSRPYFLICSLGTLSIAWIKKFSKLADKAGFDTLALPVPNGFTDSGTMEKINLPLSPLEWMEILGSASGYVGVRFHPVVVSSIIGNPVVACDLYHKHYFQRSSSKTWLLMKQFGCQEYCHSRYMVRFLTPERVLRELLKQNETIDDRKSIANKLVLNMNEYLDTVLGPRDKKV